MRKFFTIIAICLVLAIPAATLAQSPDESSYNRINVINPSINDPKSKPDDESEMTDKLEDKTQSTWNALRPAEVNLKVPASSSPSQKAKLNFLVIRAGTNRLLGAVQVSLSEDNDTAVSWISDPPSPGGHIIFEADPGRYKLTANRSGYKTMTGEFEVGKNDLTITIKLQPAEGIQNPAINFQNPRGNFQPNMMPSTISNQLPNRETASNRTGGILAFLNSLNNRNSGPNGTRDISQQFMRQGYLLNDDPSATIPFKVNIQTADNNIQLIDTSDNNIVDLGSGQGGFRYSQEDKAFVNNRMGCLKPNTQYIIRVSPRNQRSAIGQPQYQDFIINPVQSGYVNVTIKPPLSISYGGSNLANASIQNLPVASDSQLGFKCPLIFDNSTESTTWPIPGLPNVTANSGLPRFGTTTWASPQINPANFGDYHVEKSSSGFYLVSNINPQFDVRPIYFVESYLNDSGRAFIPAESGSAGNSTQWYVTTYDRNLNSDLPVLDLTRLTRVNFSPEEYREAISGVVLSTL